MAMYDVKEETNSNTLMQCLRLGELHYDEVFEHKLDKVPRNFNWQFLKICLDNNLMHIITARVPETDELVGYFVNLINPDMFSSTFVAKELAIFVHPDHRRTGLFTDLLACMEGLLIENGVTSQLLAFQEGFNESLPLKYGYRLTERVYEKIFDEE